MGMPILDTIINFTKYLTVSQSTRKISSVFTGERTTFSESHFISQGKSFVEKVISLLVKHRGVFISFFFYHYKRHIFKGSNALGTNCAAKRILNVSHTKHLGNIIIL